jgi:dUTP pyrophosphatase
MEIKIKKTHPDAVIPYKAHPSDFCYDCVAISEEEVAPNVWKYGLGLAFQIERGHTPVSVGQIVLADPDRENFIKKLFSMKTDLASNKVCLSIDARPRSSIWKTGMVLSNCEGTIDEDYRGEVSAVFYHLIPDMPRYKVGDRVCQIKLGFTLPMEFNEVDKLDDTVRGDGGYGSTGK